MSEEELKRVVLEFRTVVAQELEALNSRISAPHIRLDLLESRIDALNAKLHSMEQGWLNEFKGIYRRLEQLENKD